MGIYPGYAEYMNPSRHIRRLTIYQPSLLDRDYPQGPCQVSFTAEFNGTEKAQAFRSELYEFSRFWEPAPDPIREYAEGVADEIMAFDPERGQGTGEFRSHVIDTILRHVRHGNQVVDRIAEMGGVSITNRAVVTTEPPKREAVPWVEMPNWIWRGPDDTEFQHYRRGEVPHPISQCSTESCGRKPWTGIDTENA